VRANARGAVKLEIGRQVLVSCYYRINITNAFRITISDRLGGYRTIWKALKVNYHMNVDQETTRLLLRQMDPIASDNRRHHRLVRRTYRSKGPDNTWHIDGYDKLRPYGFLISGCIDGYSRRIMWLKCSYTNHDPAVIAGYFVETADCQNGFPEVCRTDCGTENVTVAAIQTFVTRNRTSHIYGTSPGNQRIEAWWSFFRRSSSQWWMELFEDMIAQDLFHTANVKEVDLLRFCFMSMLRKDLENVACMWNMHRIRPSTGARCPAGIPDELYFLPQPSAINCKINFPVFRLPHFITQDIRFIGNTLCQDGDIEDYFRYLCGVFGWIGPQTVDECLRLYFNLRPFIA
jgi:hypothetical protein